MTLDSETIRRLKLLPATEIPVPPPRNGAPAPEPAPGKKPTLSEHQKGMLQRHGYAALFVEGPKHPIPRKMGDNRGGWPVRLGISKSWEDTVTAGSNSKSPYHWQGLLFRVWTVSDEHAGRLLVLTKGLIEERTEGTKASWLQLEPDLDLGWFAQETQDIAKRQGFLAWDDEGLVRHLRVLEAEEKKTFQNRRWR